MNNKDVDLNAVGDYLTDAISQFDNIIDYVVDGGDGLQSEQLATRTDRRRAEATHAYP